MPKVGQPAPSFALKGYFDGKIKEYDLADYKGKWIVLFFYPLDFTFVCPTEVRGFNEKFDEFRKEGAEVFGISVDSVHSHKAWVQKEWGKLNFPLLSDANKEVIRMYDIDTNDDGALVALRATFVIDPQAVLRYMVISDNNVGRSVEETIRVLKALKTGKLCPIEWREGEKTLN